MRRPSPATILATAALFFSLSGAASAKIPITVVKTTTITDAPGYLSHARARAAMIAADRPDHPSEVTFVHCRRLSAHTISCWETEHNITTFWLDNGQPIVGDLSYVATATLINGHVRVASSL